MAPARTASRRDQSDDDGDHQLPAQPTPLTLGTSRTAGVVGVALDKTGQNTADANPATKSRFFIYCPQAPVFRIHGEYRGKGIFLLLTNWTGGRNAPARDVGRDS